MRLVLLLTKEVPPIPADIKVVNDWGSVCLMPGREHGKHICVDGPEQDIRSWLNGVSFWRGIGQPIFQDFEWCKLVEKISV